MALHTFHLILRPGLELRHTGSHQIGQHHRCHAAHQSALGIGKESAALVGCSAHHHIIIERYLTRERVLRDAVLSPRFVVVGQSEEVVLLRPRATSVVLLHRLYLWSIGEEMLAFGIESTLEEGRHTDIRLDDANLRTGILHLFAILLGQRVGHLLLPFHLILLYDGVHQQFELTIYERLSCGLWSLDVNDETG